MAGSDDKRRFGPDTWEERYQSGNIPWDTGRVSEELRGVVEDGTIAPCPTLELGCGTGTNSIFLAQRGFTVQAIDVSELAIERARRRAAAAGVNVDFVCGDVLALSAHEPAPQFVFDRGCYHAVRRSAPGEFLEMLARVTVTGTRLMALTGNADEKMEGGPPVMTQAEIRAELEPLFEIEWIAAFRFDANVNETGPGPLGWSCLMIRRPPQSTA